MRYFRFFAPYLIGILLYCGIIVEVHVIMYNIWWKQSNVVHIIENSSNYRCAYNANYVHNTLYTMLVYVESEKNKYQNTQYCLGIGYR